MLERGLSHQAGVVCYEIKCEVRIKDYTNVVNSEPYRKKMHESFYCGSRKKMIP